eukprot:5479266-Lingulodinium_polyedra.AAC.1
MHGASRAAAEVVFGLLSPIWRLDPAAVATIGPIMMAVRALRAGTVALAWWREAFAAVAADERASQRGGPMAVVLKSLRALGLGDDFE